MDVVCNPTSGEVSKLDLKYLTAHGTRLRKLIKRYKKWKLEINISKAEYMCVGGIQQIQRTKISNNGILKTDY